MLQMTINKKINARDVVISANILNQDGYVLFPRESMSNHIGFGDGCHCTVETDDYHADLAQHPIDVKTDAVQENEAIVKSYHYWILKTHFKLLLKALLSGKIFRAITG